MSDTGQTPDQPTEPTLKRRNASHAIAARRRGNPPPCKPNALPFQQVLHYNIPWTTVTYPSHALWWRCVLSRAVVPEAVDRWRSGKNRPPIWAIDDLLALMRERRAEADRLIDLLEVLRVHRVAEIESTKRRWIGRGRALQTNVIT